MTVKMMKGEGGSKMQGSSRVRPRRSGVPPRIIVLPYPPTSFTLGKTSVRYRWRVSAFTCAPQDALDLLVDQLHPLVCCFA
jgi:hypothetical protein